MPTLSIDRLPSDNAVLFMDKLSAPLSIIHAFFTLVLTLSTRTPGDNLGDSAELIDNELKYPNRWLKANKISINYTM